MGKRVRLADVAEKVGVSSKTVSNVVNGTGWVSEPVRARVREAIHDLGYRPNLAARHLRGGNSGLIALGVPHLGEPYFAELASRIVDAARARGVTVLVTQSRGERSIEQAILEGENLPALDGIVLSPLSLTHEDIAARRSGVPLVLVGEHGEQLATTTVTHIGPDNTAAARAATQFLIDQGRRRIAAVGLQNNRADTAEVRFSGYKQALTEAGIKINQDLLIEVERFNRAEGSRGIELLISRGIPFDAVFCFNDSLAFGALHTLAMHNMPVPTQVAVMGYDNIEEAQYTVPPLSSIDPGVTDASSLILDTLLNITSPHGGHITVPFSVVDRSF